MVRGNNLPLVESWRRDLLNLLVSLWVENVESFLLGTLDPLLLFDVLDPWLVREVLSLEGSRVLPSVVVVEVVVAVVLLGVLEVRESSLELLLDLVGVLVLDVVHLLSVVVG